MSAAEDATDSARAGTNMLAEQHIEGLIGLPLAIAREAAHMKVFHFGDIQPHPSGRGTVGAYALHIQCAWRIATREKVVTGSSDAHLPPSDGTNIDDGDKKAGNLQRIRLLELMQGFDNATCSHVNDTRALIVETFKMTHHGDIDIVLSGGYSLQIFAAGSQGEEWRLIRTGGAHLVFEDGKTYEI